MASLARRQIDTKFQNTSLLNKAASQSTSLYQKCSLLREKLRRIRGFTERFPDLAESLTQDPVTHLWDLFSTGTPLCYIYDQLPAKEGFKKLDYYTLSENKRSYETEINWDRAKKHGIALFAMHLRAEKITEKIPGCEMFTVTDLWERRSTDGLVKVINTVTAIVNYLPPEAFENYVASPDLSTGANFKDVLQENIIREMLETERKYVQDLETMQEFSNALSLANIISQDTLHLLFPNLNKLLNFQRKFLIRLEFTAQLPLQAQHWGQQFLENEEEFSVYEPYCVNYKSATELMLAHERSLAAFNHMVNIKFELPGLLLKPIQRICQYPLLLDSLIKAFSPETYDHYYELIRGSESAKRVIEKINEAQRYAENEEVVKKLKFRIADWKGHHIENFGDLLLHDFFVVTKSDIDREYLAFLFEKIILLAKDVGPQVDKKRKGSIKSRRTPDPSTVSAVNDALQKDTPILLKGRIFIQNIVSAKYHPSPRSQFYPLVVTWKGDEDLESFTIRCRREEQMKQWQTTISRLIAAAATRRATGQQKVDTRRSVQYSRTADDNGASSANQTYGRSRYSAISQAPISMYSRYSEVATIGGQNRYSEYEYNGEEEASDDHNSASEDNDLEEYPSPSYPPSGRGTPIEKRRLYRSRSLSTKCTSSINHDGASFLVQNVRRRRSDSLPSISTTASIESSDDSSPTTPVGDNVTQPLVGPNKIDDVDLYRAGLRINGDGDSPPSMVKLKVHFKEDIFILRLLRTVEIAALYEKLDFKIRLCGPRATTGPLRVRYQDEDGDMVLLASTEDLQMALEDRPQVTLFVT
ncbi:hypothetical protein CVT25_012351 [Psilocybe cyanescens]|uniref:DH domain-containing protein n=1 Tax=Psilocybe cyanescens TaxID=93625 RepID=A0A409XFS9_PSICY|nr:hypothetical protein CVT25_012351 [Psilocybe cyanescens]